jgi:hypothetical protein
METVSVSRPFSTDLPKMQARCRSLDSRLSWPGTVAQWETGSTLYYEVGMRLSPATLTDVTVTEELGPDEVVPGGTAFRTKQRVTWPEGTADAQAEYRFTPGSPNAVQLTYSYDPPSTSLVKAKHLPAFRVAMEKVVARYLDDLTGATVAS